MLNLKALHYAVILKRTGSFSEAARHSTVTQSAISQQVSKLEEEIGITIFDRLSKPIGLTEVGKKFLERAESLVLEAEDLWDYASLVSTRLEGHVHLGIIPTLAPYLSPLFISDLHKKHPLLKLSIFELKTLDIIRGLTDRTLQAGIIATPIHTSLNLVQTPLFYERFFVYTAAKSRHAGRKNLRLTDILPDELWLLNEGNCLSDQVTQMCSWQKEHDNQPTNSYHTDSLHALCQFMANTDGLTIMPELATLSVTVQDEDLIKGITGSKPGRELSMVHLKGAAYAQLIAMVSTEIRAALPPRMLKKQGLDVIDPKIAI